MYSPEEFKLITELRARHSAEMAALRANHSASTTALMQSQRAEMAALRAKLRASRVIVEQRHVGTEEIAPGVRRRQDGSLMISHAALRDMKARLQRDYASIDAALRISARLTIGDGWATAYGDTMQPTLSSAYEAVLQGIRDRRLHYPAMDPIAAPDDLYAEGAVALDAMERGEPRPSMPLTDAAMERYAVMQRIVAEANAGHVPRPATVPDAGETKPQINQEGE